MIGFALLVGHMVGDYIAQNDWMAANKSRSSVACFVHCVAYTFAVWCCSAAFYAWSPLGLLIVFTAHFPLDRWRLAAWWMRNVSGQRGFADGPLAPWSAVVVDNTFHLATLLVAACV